VNCIASLIVRQLSMLTKSGLNIARGGVPTRTPFDFLAASEGIRTEEMANWESCDSKRTHNTPQFE
jgi:hypothetical protein